MTLTIGDLPFREGDPVDVLRLDRKDPDYTGTGYCRLDEVWLETRGGDAVAVSDALVLALHSPEEPEAIDGDIELEFHDEGVSVLLSRFLERWLPRVTGGGEQAVVLALCNPRRAVLPAAGPTPMWYALGDVESWLDEDELGRRVRLVADEWRVAS